MYDVIIIGAGPVGLAAAIEAKRKKLNYLVLEKGVLVNSIFHFPVNMRFFTTADLLEIGGHPFPSTAIKPDRQMTLDYYRRVVQLEVLNIKLHHEVMDIQKDGNTFQFLVKETFRSKIINHQLTAKYVVIATGYFDNPNGLGGIPGEFNNNTSHNYTEPHGFYDKDVAVIGAGNSGAEASLELFRHGARVTLIHNHETPRSTLKYWVGPDLQNRLNNKEINSYMPAKVKEITNEAVIIEFEGNEKQVPVDFVFILTGFHPNITLFTKWGIDINSDYSISHSDHYEIINSSGMYIIGSAGSGKETNKVFIENGREHAVIAINDIDNKINYKQS